MLLPKPSAEPPTSPGVILEFSELGAGVKNLLLADAALGLGGAVSAETPHLSRGRGSDTSVLTRLCVLAMRGAMGRRRKESLECANYILLMTPMVHSETLVNCRTRDHVTV